MGESSDDGGGGENRGGRVLLLGISSGSTESMSRGCKCPRAGRAGRFKNAKYAVEGGEKGSCRQSSASLVDGDAIDVVVVVVGLWSRGSGAVESSVVVVVVKDMDVVVVS